MRAMHGKIFLVKTLIIDDRPFVNLPEKKTSRWSETRVTRCDPRKRTGQLPTARECG